MEHKHSLKCSICGADISADTEAKLVEAYQAHASKEHGMDLPAEKVLEMVKAQAKPK